MGSTWDLGARHIYTCAYEWEKKNVLNGKGNSPRVPHCALLLPIEVVKVLCYVILDSISYILKQQCLCISLSICLSMWAVPRRFFQSLPVPCGTSLNVISPDVTDSREKRNQG